MKKRIKWTKNKVRLESLKYKTRTEFKNKCSPAYYKAIKGDYLEEICSHMIIKKIKWTKEKVRFESLKYKTRTEFMNKCGSAYYKAIKEGYLEEICSHMVIKRRKKWTIDEIREISLKYNNKIEFRIKEYGPYLCAKRRKWLDDVCSHMKQNIQWKDKKEIVHQEALKYETRGEFCVKSERFYEIARRHNWLDELCCHMHSVGDKYRRLVYVYEFENKTAYIGLTYNEKMRHETHFNNVKSPVFRYIKESGLTPIKKIITDGYVNSEIAKKTEHETVEHYKNLGWNVLNEAKTGGLGKTCIWTKEKVRDEIIKYKTMKDFRINSINAYNAMIRYGWRDIIPNDFIISYIGMWKYNRNFKTNI